MNRLQKGSLRMSSMGTVVLLGLVAFGGTAPLALGQDMVQGKFTLPIEARLGKTVLPAGEFAGPNWEYSDGSAVVGKASGNAPGATANDIPWLKLDVISRRGSGVLTPVTTVQRINTQGGKLEGACDKAGATRSAPYAADYIFLRKG